MIAGYAKMVGMLDTDPSRSHLLTRMASRAAWGAVLAKSKDAANNADNVGRRLKGRHALYTYEDELFEQQMRRELAAKRKEVRAARSRPLVRMGGS